MSSDKYKELINTGVVKGLDFEESRDLKSKASLYGAEDHELVLFKDYNNTWTLFYGSAPAFAYEQAIQSKIDTIVGDYEAIPAIAILSRPGKEDREYQVIARDYPSVSFTDRRWVPEAELPALYQKVGETGFRRFLARAADYHAGVMLPIIDRERACLPEDEDMLDRMLARREKVFADAQRQYLEVQVQEEMERINESYPNLKFRYGHIGEKTATYDYRLISIYIEDEFGNQTSWGRFASESVGNMLQAIRSGDFEADLLSMTNEERNSISTEKPRRGRSM